jgi:hypothetical protein
LGTVVLCGVACAAVGVAACTSGPTGPTWTAVDDLSAFAAASVNDVTSNGSGFVAVGTVAASGARNGAIWTSADGLTWQAVTVDAPNAVFLRVGHAGSSLVAIGSQCSGSECVGSSFWSSPDGTAWTEQGGREDWSYPVALASGGFGVVAVGADWSTG